MTDTEEIDVLTAVRGLIVDLNLKKRNRLPEVVVPRHFLMWYLRKNTDLSLKGIGKEFDRDHSDVVYAYKKVEGYLDVNDKYWKAQVQGISDYISQFKFTPSGPPEGPITKNFSFYVDKRLHDMVMESVVKAGEGVGLSKYLRDIIKEHELNKRRGRRI